MLLMKWIKIMNKQILIWMIIKRKDQKRYRTIFFVIIKMKRMIKIRITMKETIKT